jgi:hypothetical protein
LTLKYGTIEQHLSWVAMMSSRLRVRKMSASQLRY